jgi:hypothetical protein
LLEVKLTLIGKDHGTMDGVQEYFLRAGARVRTTSWLEEASSCAADADAVILFADHFPRQLALKTSLELGVGTVIVVTAETGYFSIARTTERLAARFLVLRSPVWGWMLLDAVRSGMSGAGEA